MSSDEDGFDVAGPKLSAPGERPQRDDHQSDGSEHPDKRLGRAAGQKQLPILNKNRDQHDRENAEDETEHRSPWLHLQAHRG